MPSEITVWHYNHVPSLCGPYFCRNSFWMVDFLISKFIALVYFCVLQALVLARCSAVWSSASRETRAWRHSSSRTPFLASLCPRLWVSSAWWWPLCCCSLCKVRAFRRAPRSMRVSTPPILPQCYDSTHVNTGERDWCASKHPQTRCVWS